MRYGVQLPGSNLYQRDPRQGLAQRLLDSGTDTSPIQHTTQGLARLLQAGLGGYMTNRLMTEQSTANDAMLRGASAQPWIDPDVGEAPPGQNVGGHRGAIAALAKLPNNAFAGRLSQRLMIQQGELMNAERMRQAERRQDVEDYDTKKRIDQKYAQPKERRIVEGADGHRYFTDTGDRVLPNVQTGAAKALTPYGRAKGDFDAGHIDQPTYKAILAGAGKKPGVNVSVNGGKQLGAMETALGKKFAEQFTEREQNAIAASGTISDLNQMEELLDTGVQTGFGQGWIDAAKRFGLQAGFDIDEAALAGQEGFAAITNRMILPLVKSLGHNPTDADLRFIVQASPELSKTVEGNRLIIAALRRKAQRDIELSQMQTEFYSNNGTLSGFASAVAAFERDNPLFNPEERTALYQAARSTIPQYGRGGNAQRAAPAEITPDAAAKELERRHGPNWRQKLGGNR